MKKRKKFHAAVMAALDPAPHLVYVQYDDKLNDDQVDALARQNWEQIDDSFDGWLPDHTYESAKIYIADAVREVVDTWADEEILGPDYDYDSLAEKYEGTDEWDEARFVLEERDQSSPLTDLAANVGIVLMRHSPGIDVGTQATVEDVLEELAASDTLIPWSGRNETLIQEAIDNSGGCGDLQFIYACDAKILVEISQGLVQVKNPHLWIGSSWHGSGHCVGPLEGSIFIPREDLRTDRDASGYGWDQVASVYARGYECEVTQATLPDFRDPVAIQEWLDAS